MQDQHRPRKDLEADDTEQEAMLNWKAKLDTEQVAAVLMALALNGSLDTMTESFDLEQLRRDAPVDWTPEFRRIVAEAMPHGAV